MSFPPINSDNVCILELQKTNFLFAGPSRSPTVAMPSLTVSLLSGTTSSLPSAAKCSQFEWSLDDKTTFLLLQSVVALVNSTPDSRRVPKKEIVHRKNIYLYDSMKSESRVRVLL